MSLSSLMNRLIGAKAKQKLTLEESIRPEYDQVEITKPPVFVLGTGRCGTHFLESIMREDPGLLAVHTDAINADSDSFFRYILWYNLPVDLQAFRQYRHRLIVSAQLQDKRYFESNMYLSLAASYLHEWYNARLVLLVRNPVNVVNSHMVKGWYDGPDVVREDSSVAPGFPPDMRANHFFGRIIPCGDEYDRWSRLTRIGKISWWVNQLNLQVMESFTSIPEYACQILRVEDLDYERYLSLHRLTGGQQPLTRHRFDEIRASRPGKGRRHMHSDNWNDQERAEFNEQTAMLRDVLGYDKI